MFAWERRGAERLFTIAVKLARMKENLNEVPAAGFFPEKIA
jgi:hypothetical protein